MTQYTTLSRSRPADVSMDYDRLRAEGISHLEALASEIWTDFNAHDPGITILEVLCYAITDLGYRANLPLADLLTGAPGDQRQIFFPIHDVLPNEPVTELDYRKLFIDVDGVKNAWLYRYLEPNPFLAATEQDQLNGLYDVLVELEDGILPDSKRARQIEAAIRARYHAHRNLGEDLARVRFVRDCPVCICLDVELELDANEEETMALIMFNIQQFLAPQPKFYSFRELREQGVACEDIFNGPLLQHGFLPDSELEMAPLRRKIYKSDIIGVIMETAGVIRVQDLRWRKASGDSFGNDWCLDISCCGLLENEDPCVTIFQPFLDVCCSRMRTTKGVLVRQLTEDDIKEELELLQLLQEVPADTRGPEIPRGQYREDLADYASIQYEFPDTYTVGAQDLPQVTTDLRRAQRRQLQGFLLFFDQILAAYLQQLAEVRNLLAVDQDPSERTYFFQALCEVPGMPDLIADFAVYKLSDDTIALLVAEPALPDPVKDKLENLPPDFPRIFHSETAFQESMRAYIGTAWDIHGSFLSSRLSVEAELDDWTAYCSTEDGAYHTEMSSLTEGLGQRQLRRNQIMDHLLARFGEQFTTFSLQLFSTRVDRENDPTTQAFPDYLENKATFLREIPMLASERGRAYNYRARHAGSGAPDVWNSDNVAGLKKRVSRLIGIDDYSARSLICDPDYDIRIRRGEAASGRPNYQLQLIDREQQQVLLESKVYNSRQKRQVLEIHEVLRKELDQLDRYTIVPDDSRHRVQFEYEFDNERGQTVNIQLLSPLMSQQEARRRREEIMDLVRNPTCEREGFHLLEHILLRPNDASDELLALPSGSCLADELTDPYSFVLTVILPDWPQRFRDQNFRSYLQQIFRRETPAHIILRFCWIDVDTMQEFERPYQRWREELSRCEPDECQVNVWADQLIEWLNNEPCPCEEYLPEDDLFCEPEGDLTGTGTRS